MALTLADVRTWGRPYADDSRQPFTVHLYGPMEPMLVQSTYHLEHATIGGVEIFLVPLGPDQGQMLYEAVFA